MRRDTRLERMFETDQGWKDRQDSQRRLAFERKVVRKLLDAGGVTTLDRKLMEGMWESDDNHDFYLTFGWMNEEYPNFPFLLTAAEHTWKARAVEVFIASAKHCKLWKLWRDVKKEFSKEVAVSHQIALMIPCSQESGLYPGLVMHNGALPDGPFKSLLQNQLRVRLVEPRTEAFVFLQRLDYFAAQVALQWQA